MPNRRRKVILLGASVALSVSAVSQFALAQDETGGQEIVVTAQKRSEKAKDVPASLTVLTSQDLARAGVVNNLDLTALTPGLKMDRVGAFTSPALRGITTLLTAPGLDANVATYVGGVYIGNPVALTMDMPDVRQVEVLKGPQGTLFGRNATGGAIQISTMKPSFTPTGTISASYGNFSDQSVKGFIAGPLVGDKLAGSLAVYEQSSDGYLHDIVTGKDAGETNSQLVRGKLLFAPSDDTEFTFGAYVSHSNYPNATWATALNGNTVARNIPGSIIPSRPYDVATNRPVHEDGWGYGVNLNGKIELKPGTLTLIGAYNYYLSKSLTSAYDAFTPTSGPFASGGLFYIGRSPDQNYSVELNFASRQYGPFSYIAGLYFYKDHAAYDPLAIIQNPLSALGFAISIFGHQRDTSYAGFAEFAYKITDRLTAIAGARYSIERREIFGQGLFGVVSEDNAPSPLLDHGHKTFESLTPRASLRYAIDDKTNVYFTFSQGFKSGGYDPSEVFGAVGEIRPVAPEKVLAYEIGAKSEPTPWLTVNGAVFYYDYKNQQVHSYQYLGSPPVPLGVIENAASSTIYGLDLEGTAKATEELSFRAGLSLLHARFDKFDAAQVAVPNPGNDGNTNVAENAKGKALARSPDWTLTFGMVYRKELEKGIFGFTADVYHSDTIYYEPGNRVRQDPYTTLNSSVSWTLKNRDITFSLWGRNLTDETTILGTFITEISTALAYGSPRTYGVRVSAGF